MVGTQAGRARASKAGGLDGLVEPVAPTAVVPGALGNPGRARAALHVLDPGLRLHCIARSAAGMTTGTHSLGERGIAMTTYVSLVNWTQQGAQNFPDAINRAEEFTKLVENSGGSVRELLWTLGDYDSLTIVDFPRRRDGGCRIPPGRRQRPGPHPHHARLRHRRDVKHHPQGNLSACATSI